MKTLRDIFPLSPDEHVLAEGHYRYLHNGQVTDIVEPWAQYQHEGNTVTRTLRSDGRHFVLGVKFWDVADTRFASFYWENAVGSYTVNYAVQNNRVRWNIEGEPGQTLLLEQPTSFFPLMRIFSGATLLTILENNGRCQVLVPSIKTPEQRDTLFQPLVTERTVERLDDGAYLYRGGEYDDAARYELTQCGILQRYSWQQSEREHWDVELIEP